MSQLLEAIRLIEQQVAVKKACCAIADEGWAGESSMLGTRDGYLNLAMALLRFVTEADAGACHEMEEDCAWDDRLKSTLYQLPTDHSVWIVGAYLFPNHTEFMAKLSQFVNPQIEHPLLNDPQFDDPEAADNP